MTPDVIPPCKNRARCGNEAVARVAVYTDATEFTIHYVCESCVDGFIDDACSGWDYDVRVRDLATGHSTQNTPFFSNYGQ